MKFCLLKLFFGVLFLAFSFFIPPSLFASESRTTVYFPSFEKILETGDWHKYYSAGNVTLQRTEDSLYYLLPDHLSSTRVIADKNLTTVDYISYYPFGKLRSERPTSPKITNLYTSQKLDFLTDLYYYHARYYNPQTAHFLSADPPAGGQGPNRYAYVANNPINFNDPSGRQTEADDIGLLLAKKFLVPAWGPKENYVPVWKEISKNVLANAPYIYNALKDLERNPIYFETVKLKQWQNLLEGKKNQAGLFIFEPQLLRNLPRLEGVNPAMVLAVALAERNVDPASGYDYLVDFQDPFASLNAHGLYDLNTFLLQHYQKGIDPRLDYGHLESGELAANIFSLTLAVKSKFEQVGLVTLTDPQANLTEAGKRVLGNYQGGGVNNPGVQRYFRLYNALKSFALEYQQYNYLLTPFNVRFPTSNYRERVRRRDFLE